MTSSEVLEVEATPIEDGIATQDSIQRQLADLSHRATELAAQYRPHEIADRQDHKDSKRSRGAVRKDAEAIRKAGKDITARVDAWSAGVRAEASRIAERLDAVGEEFDAYCKSYEDGLLEARMGLLRERYEEYAPGLALPAEGTDAALVPFGILWSRFSKAEGWARLTTSDAKAVQGMEAVVEGIAQAERNIDKLVAEQDRKDVKALFFSTLSLDRAMARAGGLADARAKVQAMEAERATWQVGAAAEPEPTAEAEPHVAPAPRPVDPQPVVTREQYEADYEAIHGAPLPKPQPTPEPTATRTWGFCGYCTPQQAGAIEDYARRIGVSSIRTFDTRGRKGFFNVPKEA
ncbi:MAG: hypothetical protein IKG69_09900 [Atopobiaceae bacterium]|nr:hypothetical protein [Atopobiaceae bacterium]MBR3385493.1 hypothetical protein [Atopobiaceae bacterium]